jgi:metallo-beta-lactamase class B
VKRVLAVAALLLAASLSAQRTAEERAEWNKPVAPFRIAGNVYYVGAAGVASYLISTPRGLIVLDGGLPETARLVVENLRRLDFPISDVRYLLNSHAHFDHAGGLVQLKRLSGAQMIASRADAKILESGEKFPKTVVERIVGDGDTVQLADVTLTAHLTPGHTPGCTTWTMPVEEHLQRFNIVFYCSTTVVSPLVNNREYPSIVSDYEATFAKLRTIPCDIFLAPHPSFFDLTAKRARLGRPGENPFIRPGEMAAYVARSEADFREELARQRATMR